MVQVKVSIDKHWDHFALWLLSLLGVLAYIGVRVWYLISGRTKKLGQDGVSIPYSWMVLLAEAALSTLGVYLHQNFWKQKVEFSELPDTALEHMHRVRLC